MTAVIYFASASGVCAIPTREQGNSMQMWDLRNLISDSKSFLRLDRKARENKSANSERQANGTFLDIQYHIREHKNGMYQGFIYNDSDIPDFLG